MLALAPSMKAGQSQQCLNVSRQGLSLDKILMQLAAEPKARPPQVNADVELLDGGATVPFIAGCTKGMIARESGIEPLADKLFADPSLDPQSDTAAFVNADAGFADTFAVLY